MTRLRNLQPGLGALWGSLQLHIAQDDLLVGDLHFVLFNGGGDDLIGLVLDVGAAGTLDPGYIL